MIPPGAKNFRINEYLLFAFLVFMFVNLPIIALLGFILYVPIFLLACFLPNYGKFVSYFDSWLEEDFVTNTPRSSIVATLTLNGDISLEELRLIFQKQVLEARSKVNSRKLRYPELTQYLGTFICFRIWKKDHCFNIENHIVEHHNFDRNLDDVHSELQNKTFQKNRSPWEIVLFRNVTLTDENTNFEKTDQKSVVAFRSHHVLADGKSVLKLLVECLGNKKLKTASSSATSETVLEKLKFLVFFPVMYFVKYMKVSILACQSHNHPWKVYDDRRVKTVVRFSPHIRMLDIKYVAKVNGVTSSAVVMSIVTGAIRKYCGEKWDKEVAIGYPFPRPDHPESLTNHLYWGTLILPTDQACERKRLLKCNEDFVQAKVGNQGKYWNWSVLLGGFIIFPFSRLAVNILTPIGKQIYYDNFF